MDNLKSLSIDGLVRLDILNAAHSAGKSGAHIAPSLSDADICLAILKRFREREDSFVLSKGHGALGYYAAMHQIGMLSDEQFESFEKNGGAFPGQPSRYPGNKVEFSSGSLGMGLPYALGVALAKKAGPGTVYVVIGDGELNEGSNWEAAALASRYRLSNLVAVVDRNGLQSDGDCNNIMGQDISALWLACGWQVEQCDGHSIPALESSMTGAHPDKPLVILAKTVKGKGVSFMENNNAWHHSVLKDEDYQRAVQEIEDAYQLH